MSLFRFGIIAAVLMLTGCAAAVSSGYGQGGHDESGRSYSEARADNSLTAQVTTLLVEDRQVPAMGIRVSTLNGVVTLEGEVPSHAVAYRAERLAASVEGVVAVNNRLHPRR